jgi:hypothetical protein
VAYRGVFAGILYTRPRNLPLISPCKIIKTTFIHPSYGQGLHAGALSKRKTIDNKKTAPVQ